MEQSLAMISKAAVSFSRLFCGRLRLILIFSFVVLIVTAILAPLLNLTAYSTISTVVYGLDSHFCHQIPERCLHIAGSPFAVCARCFGGYIGFLMAGLIFTRRASLPAGISYAITLFGVIGLLDAACQIAQLYSTGNIMRLVSGAALGFASGMFAFRFVCSIENALEAELTSAARV